MSSSQETLQQIESLIQSDRIVLFMKGNRQFPQCGFSATVVQVLNQLVADYKTVNVLSDPAIRQGIKDYSNWPTIPQLYVGGEFIGGCDIVREMFATGELQKKLDVEAGAVKLPAITITESAAAALRKALADAGPSDRVHLGVSLDFEHSLGLGPAEAGELEVEAAGLTVQVDALSAARADGLMIDYVEGPAGAGFKIDNPNAPAQIEQISAADLKAKLDAGEIAQLFDVRSEQEREIASIASAVKLDDDTVARIESLDKDTPIAFICHTGRRSQTAAEHFRKQGFRKLYNVTGGIDAWSREVDSSVPRY